VGVQSGSFSEGPRTPDGQWKPRSGACRAGVQERSGARRLVREILGIAQRAPSGGNLQHGGLCPDRAPLAALKAAAKARDANTKPNIRLPANLWDRFRTRRWQCGRTRSIGIPRADGPGARPDGTRTWLSRARSEECSLHDRQLNEPEVVGHGHVHAGGDVAGR